MAGAAPSKHRMSLHAATEVYNVTHSHEVSTKVCVFVSMQLVFIGFPHHPTFRKLGGNSS